MGSHYIIINGVPKSPNFDANPVYDDGHIIEYRVLATISAFNDIKMLYHNWYFDWEVEVSEVSADSS